MNKKTWIIVGYIVLIGIIGGLSASVSNKEASMKKENISADAMKKDTDNTVMNGTYETYSPEKLAQAENGNVVLFFHASWCPSCRSLNSNIEDNIGTIPAGVTILKVNFDKETELKKKYGVTYQHTLVQVDKNGELIKKWSGSPKLSNLISEIQ